MSENQPESLLPFVSQFPSRVETLCLRAEELCQTGGNEKLGADDRRDALQYLMSVRPDLNNVDLGRCFKVDEKVIRLDKGIISKRLGDENGIKDSAVALADRIREHEINMARLEKSLKKCSLGTPSYLSHVKYMEEATIRMLQLLQDFGVYPRNLGNSTKTVFVYKSSVAKGGGVDTRQINSAEELLTIEAQEVKLLPGAYESDEDRAIRESLALEFADTTSSAIAAPTVPEAGHSLADRIKRGPS